MRPKNATQPIRKYDNAKSSSMALLEKMNEQGLFYRSNIRLNDSRIEKLSGFQEGHKLEMRTDAVIKMIRAYQEKFGPEAPSDAIVEGLKDYEPNDYGKVSVFLNDEDFQFLQGLSRRSGLRKSASRGLALLVDSMC